MRDKSLYSENKGNIVLDGFANRSIIPSVARKNITREQVIALMRKQQGSRTAKEYAMALGVSESYISEVYRGTRDPGESILNKLGLLKKIVYEEVVIAS